MKIRVKYTFHLLLFLSFFASPVCAQHQRHKGSGNGWRYNFGTSINNYTLNDKHGQDPRQKMNATIGIRRELRVVRDYKTFLLFGAEYVFHGLNYRSYFFKPDSVKLYDRKYSYNYSLRLNELHIPVEIKYLLRRVDNSLFSPYLLFGYHLRYLLPASLTVTKDGEIYKKDHPDMLFRTSIFSKKINASLCASLGWQLNRLGSSRRTFFAEVSFQYGFSDYYFKSDYSANSMYINCVQATFNLGAKF